MIIVCVFFFVGFLYICIIHRNESVDISTAAFTLGSSRLEGLDKAVIESFPVFEYSRVKDKDLKTGKEAVECELAFHVTCPVCRAQLTDTISDAKPGRSNTTVLNANSNTESSAPTTEGNANVVVEVDEGTQRENFQRCHSTGHSVIQPGENVEMFTS
ncbi:hypothetical protein F3Y22_tig00111650pilonHSYRG00294 [Hibiscus syriacus]|uniref:Uncharacterized protein n=1 Tax=Hibiscus syriacus TaxID=106335 RepID=A0A6A2YIU6_HIBSY|nr:hypothetical protein F3Y22_tig00111650pilonHSYRG00294 [Hibiscus syriacus]